MITKIISYLLIFLFLPLNVSTYGIDLIGSGKREEEIKINIAGIGAIFRSQGITTDGESLYFSSKTTLIKTDMNGLITEKANLSAISKELRENYGIKHIGGISYYNGKLYCGMEDSKKWQSPAIGVFDAQSLEMTDYYIIDSTLVTRGMPWVAVDGSTGLLWCMDHSKSPTKLLAFDTGNDMALIEETPLLGECGKVQGGEFLDGSLFVASNGDEGAIMKIDVLNGDVQKLYDRSLLGGEGEGMTIINRDGESKILALDLGTIFVNSFLREYSLEQTK